MNRFLALAAPLLSVFALPVLASAQIPDLLNSLEPGSPSLGAGGAFDPTAANTFSTFYNPAGLAYITRRQVSAAYRNLPKSSTILSGDFANPGLNSDARRGSDAISHLGYAQPAGRNGGFGVSFTTGGYVDDVRSGTNLATGNFTLTQYAEEIRAKSDFYNVGFGRTNRAGNLAFGVGVVLASVSVDNRTAGTLVDGANSPLPFSAVDTSSTGTGIGAIVGLQYSPVNTPGTSFGLSVRTPIELTGNDDTEDLFDRVPGVIRLGFASRRDLSGGNALTYGAHLATYFGGDGNGILDRSNQTTFGLGAEYGLRRGEATIPLRIGYMLVPSGGDGFGRRDALTLGVGYRPADSRFSIDAAYALPSGSGRQNDLAITASYRFN